jgi:hypothetical protein
MADAKLVTTADHPLYFVTGVASPPSASSLSVVAGATRCSAIASSPRRGAARSHRALIRTTHPSFSWGGSTTFRSRISATPPSPPLVLGVTYVELVRGTRPSDPATPPGPIPVDTRIAAASRLWCLTYSGGSWPRMISRLRDGARDRCAWGRRAANRRSAGSTRPARRRRRPLCPSRAPRTGHRPTSDARIYTSARVGARQI